MHEIEEVLNCQETATYALLVDPDPELRIRGIQELGRLPRASLHDDGAEAMKQLGPLLVDPSGTVQLATCVAIAELGALGNSNIGHKAAACARNLLERGDLHIRLEAVRTLAKLGEATETHVDALAHAFRRSTVAAPPDDISETLAAQLRSGGRPAQPQPPRAAGRRDRGGYPGSLYISIQVYMLLYILLRKGNVYNIIN